MWLIESLGLPRPEIEEWRAPDLLAAGALKIWVMLGLIAFGILGSSKNRDLAKCLTLAIVIVQAISHQRHLPFVAILFGFWLPTAIDNASWKCFGGVLDKSHLPKWSPVIGKLVVALLVGTCVFQAIAVGRRLQEIPVPTERFPVAAIQFMHDNNLQRRVVVAGEWAQYLLAVSGGRLANDQGLRVAFDGRFRTCYPQSVVDMHFDFFRGTDNVLRYRVAHSENTDPARILNFGKPHLVLVKNSQKHALRLLEEKRQEWVMLYRDGTAQIWGRAQRYDDCDSEHYFPEDRRRIAHENAEALAGEYSPWPAAPYNFAGENIADKRSPASHATDTTRTRLVTEDGSDSKDRESGNSL